MIDEQTLKRFVKCGQAAQLAIDKVLAEHAKETRLEKAAKKAQTGNRKDLHEYLKLRRELRDVFLH